MPSSSGTNCRVTVKHTKDWYQVLHSLADEQAFITGLLNETMSEWGNTMIGFSGNTFRTPGSPRPEVGNQQPHSECEFLSAHAVIWWSPNLPAVWYLVCITHFLLYADRSSRYWFGVKMKAVRVFLANSMLEPCSYFSTLIPKYLFL